MIQLKQIHFAYPDIQDIRRKNGIRKNALESIEMEIPSRTKIALLGANGSGKTTILQILNGLLKPDSGEILWHNRPLQYSSKALFEFRSKVTTLLQDPEDQLFGGCVYEDVSLGPTNQGLHRDEIHSRTIKALQEVDLESLAHCAIPLLSYGQKKLTALAGMLAMKPEILLLDEPTAGLDPQREKNLLRILDERVVQGSSVVFSTHDVDLAFQWADQIIILSHGKIVASGSPQNCLRFAANMENWNLRVPNLHFPTRNSSNERQSHARILVTTGNGKGKTSSAMGMVLRSVGHGKQTAICQFIKHRENTGEHLALQNHSLIRWRQFGKGFLPKDQNASIEEHQRIVRNGWRWARTAIRSSQISVIVLDEICNALHRDLLPLEPVLAELRNAAKGKVIICTGRNAPFALMQLADTVTEMRVIKHGFQIGIPSQPGVEK